jgi:hypothetical protein
LSDVTLSVVEDLPEGVIYDWDFGTNAIPPTGTGLGPHTIQYTISGVKTVTLTITYQSQEVSATTNITVNSCFGNIVGSIEDLAGNPLQTYNMRLFQDFNDDGIPDGAAVRNVFSTSLGGWAMASLPPGIYILEQTNGVIAPTVSITDLNTLSPGFDQILDVFTPVTPVANPANTAVRVQVRPNLIQGPIKIIMNI